MKDYNEWYYKDEGYKWEHFKNKFEGRRCFLVGNGPSIRTQDLTVLKDEIVFVANAFVLHEDFEKINPLFYCLHTWEIFGTPYNAEKINRDVKFNEDVYPEMVSKVKNSIVVAPWMFKNSIVEQNLFPDLDWMYLSYDPEKIEKDNHIIHSQRINLDIAKQNIQQGHSVTINFMFPMAHFMGFKEIYLLGCDLDYTKDVTRFYQDVYPEEKEWHHDSYQALYNTFRPNGPVGMCYMLIRRLFEKDGIKIYNATRGGRLEAFERVNLECLS